MKKGQWREGAGGIFVDELGAERGAEGKLRGLGEGMLRDQLKKTGEVMLLAGGFGKGGSWDFRGRGMLRLGFPDVCC
ncbi:hypothetical protein CDL15_Pgr023602 [Punica granatum]|uniref:Uncharacterized protein n=1 Tax=Punica granatum TaxID=22663 RepID=A0A218W6X9_PUNGR|nr:hypothetical protein CDL15_Pgr023602 [Punica granatum]PKI44968.1 hypothetical protein CRG98_034663 [Punica granatum]